MLSMTILEAMADAVENMVAQEPATAEDMQQQHERLKTQLDQLNQLEAADYNRMLNTPVPIEPWFLDPLMGTEKKSECGCSLFPTVHYLPSLIACLTCPSVYVCDSFSSFGRPLLERRY